MELLPLVQGFIVIIMIGAIYSLWQTSRAYGGLVGRGLRWIGTGICFFSVEALDRVLGHLSFVTSSFGANAEIAHYALLLFGLLFSGIGFSILTKINK